MTVVGSGVVELRTDDKKLDQGLAGAKGKVTKTLDEIDAKAGAVGTSFAQKLGGFLKGAVVGAAASAAVGVLGDMVKVAREAEVVEGRLAAAVKATGASWAVARKEIDATVDSLDHFAFNDSVVKSALAILVSETGSYEEALIRLRIAMDFARGANIDLYTAAKLIGKVTDENVRVLGRYGITVKAGADAQDVLNAVQARFSGQAEAYANTQQASADRMANAWEHAEEVVGGAAAGILGPVSNVSTTVQGFGLTFGSVTGGLIGFAKAGAGTTPVLTGLKGAITGVGSALKLLFLNPVGLAIVAVVLLVAGLKILYNHSEAFRKIVHAIGNALMQVLGPALKLVGGILGWIGEKLGGLAHELGVAGDSADAMGQDFTAAAGEAKTAIRSIGDQLIDLNKMFRPAAADKTEQFLKALGADPDLINQALDALYNTVGADQATRFKKVTDRAYKQLTEEADKAILEEAAANLKAAADMTEADFAKLAKSLGKTPFEYMAELKQQYADAEKVAAHYNAQIAKGIVDARNLGQAELDAGNRMTAHLKAIDALQAGWDRARAAADYYYRGVLSQTFPSAPGTNRGEPHDVAPFAIGTQNPGGGSPHVSFVVNQNLTYSGDTAAMASGAADEAVDGLTEALRQQQRRLANVATV